MNATTGGETWMSIGAAAEAATVPRRNAFRWARAGLLPVRRIGRRRCLEVGSLRLFAANRRCGSAMALFSASPFNSGPDSPGGPLPAARQADLEAIASSVALVEEQVGAMWSRLERMERALGLE